MKNSFIKALSYFKENYSLDVRALSLMRMGIALLLMWDLIIRSTSLVAFYTDEGLLPLKTLFATNWHSSFFSVYTISGSPAAIACLFVLNFLFAIQLFLGFKTRLANILCWLFLVSLHNRNPIILQGGDELLRLLLFWGIFMPWGKRYSVDSILSNSDNAIARNSTKWYDVPALGYTVLVFSVYFFSALLKTSDEWRKDFTAMYYALSLDSLSWPLGKALYPHAGILKALTAITFYLELFGPFLLFIPWKNEKFRLIFIYCFFAFHLFISITMYVGLFFLINWISFVGFLPSAQLDRIEELSWVKKIKSFFRKIFTIAAGLYPVKLSITAKIEPMLNEFWKYQLRLLAQGLLFFVLCLNVLWCIQLLEKSPLKVSKNFLWVVYTFRFDQNWGMFAPSVYKNDGWYIYEATTTDNKIIDLNRNGEPVSYERPKDLIAMVENDRWRKFGEIWQQEPVKVKFGFCHYLKNKWNKEHPALPVKDIKIVYMLEESLPDYKVAPMRKTIPCNCDSLAQAGFGPY